MQIDIENTKLQLNMDAARVQELVEHIREYEDIWEDFSEVRRRLKDFVVPIWTLDPAIDARPRSDYSSIFDGLQQLVRNAHILSGREDDTKRTDPDFYYLFANGVGELLYAVNQTEFCYVEEESRRTDAERDLIVLVTLAASIASYVIFILILIPITLKLEGKNHKVWKKLKSSRLVTLMEVLSAVSKRLVYDHGKDEYFEPD
jgi:hypothetical protein